MFTERNNKMKIELPITDIEEVLISWDSLKKEINDMSIAFYNGDINKKLFEDVSKNLADFLPDIKKATDEENVIDALEHIKMARDMIRLSKGGVSKWVN